MIKIPTKLKKRPFTYQQAIAAGLNLRNFRSLVAKGTFTQITRGVYLPTMGNWDYNEEEQFRVATLVVGTPSAVCLISALSFYNLTDLIPKKVWIMVPNSKRTQDKQIKAQRIRNPNWDIGIKKDNGYSITSIERTVVDAICAKNKIGTNTAVEALRRAVKSKQTTYSKIMEMAKQLEVLHRVLPYIEALT
jgi:predicted transcriptional regulator of viral defense system